MKNVSTSMFVATIMRHFKQGGNQSTAAKEMGITPAAVCLRIKYLRSIGAKVPKSRGELVKVKDRKRIKMMAVKEMKRWM
jgi:predicted transcriptional regulator